VCSAVIENRPGWRKKDLNFPEASDDEREAAMGRRSAFSSKFEGVCLHAASGKWRATPTIGGKQTYLGHYENETDAALACDRHASANHPSEH
jgi:hypothetical protein